MLLKDVDRERRAYFESLLPEESAHLNRLASRTEKFAVAEQLLRPELDYELNFISDYKQHLSEQERVDFQALLNMKKRTARNSFNLFLIGGAFGVVYGLATSSPTQKITKGVFGGMGVGLLSGIAFYAYRTRAIQGEADQFYYLIQLRRNRQR